MSIPQIKSSPGRWTVEVNGETIHCVHAMCLTQGADDEVWYDESRFEYVTVDDAKIARQADQIAAVRKVVLVNSKAYYSDDGRIKYFKRNKGYVGVYAVDSVKVTGEGVLLFRMLELLLPLHEVLINGREHVLREWEPYVLLGRRKIPFWPAHPNALPFLLQHQWLTDNI